MYQSGIYQLAVDTNVVLGSHLLSRLNLINFMSQKFSGGPPGNFLANNKHQRAGYFLAHKLAFGIPM